MSFKQLIHDKGFFGALFAEASKVIVPGLRITTGVAAAAATVASAPVLAAIPGGFGATVAGAALSVKELAVGAKGLLVLIGDWMDNGKRDGSFKPE